MKKTILTGASILALSISGPAFAQATAIGAAETPALCPPGATNCSVTDQDGSDLDITVEQTGTGGVSDIDQDGEGLEAEVAALKSTQDDAGDQEAGDDEEDVDTKEARAEHTRKGVEQYHRQHGHAAHDLDIETILPSAHMSP